MRAVNIQWDTDGDDEIFESLPREVQIPEHVSPEDIGDYLSDEYGYCHFGFQVMPNADIRELEINPDWLMPKGHELRAFFVPHRRAFDDICRVLYDGDEDIDFTAADKTHYPATMLFLTHDGEGRCLGTEQYLMDKWLTMFKSMIRGLIDYSEEKRNNTKKGS